MAVCFAQIIFEKVKSTTDDEELNQIVLIIALRHSIESIERRFSNGKF
jgi:hypothetical protein